MRKDITRIGVIASHVANKHYDEKIKPYFDEIKKKEGKEVYSSTVMLRASADLFHTIDDYDAYVEQLDMLVGIMKEQANKNKKG